ncbi:MAG TPA: GNAT family N-acetyltransferase [Acidimicrobiales bacterium]|nr:GNAT family N-acetyltransferase [Acidimicrobiales bacterium]
MGILVHPVLGNIEVREVPEELTLALRQEVLRPHQRAEELVLGSAGVPGAVNVAAITAGGEVVGTARVAPEEVPRQMSPVLKAAKVLGLSEAQWRMRCVATRADVRRGGVGTAVLAAVVAHVAASGGGLLWCNARIGAQAFYVSQGFETFGEPWDEELIGPHVVMWRLVEAVEAKPQ